MTGVPQGMAGTTRQDLLRVTARVLFSLGHRGLAISRIIR